MGIHDDPSDHSDSTVTPHDDNPLPSTTKGIRIFTSAGNVAVQYTDGSTDTIPNVQLYEYLPVRAVKILATGTTAVGFTVFWD